MQDLPAAGRLAAWGTAALTGACSLDNAADAVPGADDPPHRVSGLPGEPEAVSLAYALGRLRALGATGLRLVLPRPGDAAGLPGPPGFTVAAVEAGAAVLVEGAALGLLPAGRGAWCAYAVAPDRRTPLSVRDAERALTAAVREAGQALSALDVARWDPVAAQLLAARSQARRSPLPPSVPGPAHALLAQALRLAALADVALAGEGGALTSPVMAQRSGVLRDLDTAARRAVEAACSAPVA